MDPLALLPYALAAGGGRVGPYETTTLVAAGLTLLQRCAPLVRALSGKRAGVLLPDGPEWIVALAASEGRGAVVLDPLVLRDDLVTHITNYRIGAIFTKSALAERLPVGIPHVLLDEAPTRVHVIAGDRTTTIDLGSHFGLDLAGDSSVDGANEECLLYAASGTAITHWQLLADARRCMELHQFTPVDCTLTLAPLSDLDTLPCGVLAPLLAGGRLHLSPAAVSSSTALMDFHPPLTMIVGHEAALDAVRHVDALSSGQIETIMLTPRS
ncbi:hypothetical protein [Gemmatimonas phototrophica]|uniref:AMP-dependent synthetase/ligase domain-containing protein n=1 Tax=Gemmatimonas phototrophica TaxID=1379270 RepID=A0A143BL97_9BACT|nr:hypothetical protein [Gemmatimonas phototrophica]AMW05365.1 hypothetical protein GEMMAAP_12255 [Gemmatimonas phototrophica]